MPHQLATDEFRHAYRDRISKAFVSWRIRAPARLLVAKASPRIWKSLKTFTLDGRKAANTPSQYPVNLFCTSLCGRASMNFSHPALTALVRTERHQRHPPPRPVLAGVRSFSLEGVERGHYHRIGRVRIGSFSISGRHSRNRHQIHVVLCPSSRLVDARTVRAACKAGGNSRPRFSALRRIPRAAFGLKKYRSDTLLCRTADKEHAAAALGDSEMLAVQNPPADSRPAFP